MLLTLEMCRAPETHTEVLKDKAQASKAYLVNCYLVFFFFGFCFMKAITRIYLLDWLVILAQNKTYEISYVKSFFLYHLDQPTPSSSPRKCHSTLDLPSCTSYKVQRKKPKLEPTRICNSDCRALIFFKNYLLLRL